MSKGNKGSKVSNGTVAQVAAQVAAPAPKRALRTMQNGVKHPLPGGKCAAVWAFCDSVLATSGSAPTTAQVKQHSAAQGWNANNTTIELSYWRKYHGIPARSVAVVAQPAEVQG